MKEAESPVDLADLAATVAGGRRDPPLYRAGSAPMCGMPSTLPPRGRAASQVRRLITQLPTKGSA